MRPIYLLVFSFLLPFVSQAQIGLSSGGIVSGQVVDAATGMPLASVAIVNVATQSGDYTDASGHYSIRAKGGEQISASYLGYKTVTVNVSSGDALIQPKILLARLNYGMNEFIVRPKYSQYEADSIQRYSTYERTLLRHREGSVMSPASWVAEKLSGKSKAMFRFQKDFARMEDERFIDTRYGPELVAKMTGLQGDTLAHFMNAYPMDYEFARNAKELELKMWIRTNFKEWKAKRIPTSPTTILGTNK